MFSVKMSCESLPSPPFLKMVPPFSHIASTFPTKNISIRKKYIRESKKSVTTERFRELLPEVSILPPLIA